VRGKQMNCLNCGALLNESSHCPKCGFDAIVQKKVYLMSNQFYNKGLEKAEIRDLSGAIDLLQRSLKFNKLNIQARNLLGLVYFEMGEAVSALSEWVISKNIMPENNIASEYINRLQSNGNKLDTINQTIKKYNEALNCCRNGSSDIAMIQLKKILVQNPKFIKAYHLQALNYIEQNAYEKARRILKKAAKIDKTNSTTLRFLREVDERTGMQTSLESRWGRNFFRGGKEKGEEEYNAGEAAVIIPPTFRESSVHATLLNLGFGLVIGALVVWFLVVPANTQKINREANQKVTEYSNAMASQASEMAKMEERIRESEETVKTAEDQIEEADKLAESYENLIKAFNAYQEENYTNAANALMGVDATLLSVDAKAIYDSIYADVRSTLFAKYSEDGKDAYDNGDYATAIDQLGKAKEIDSTDYEVLNYLALAYRGAGDNENAIKVFKEIIEQFEGTKASSAQYYIDVINGVATEETGSDSEQGSDAGYDDGSSGDSGAGDYGDGSGDSGDSGGYGDAGNDGYGDAGYDNE